EAEDFRLRPLRVLEAEITETIDNGLFEPGEKLHARVRLRNFAAAGLAGRDVQLSIVALDEGSSVISIGHEVLVRDLRSRSITDVHRALELRLNPSAAGKVSRFVIRARYQGREGGEQTVEIEANYMLDVSLERE